MHNSNVEINSCCSGLALIGFQWRKLWRWLVHSSDVRQTIPKRRVQLKCIRWHWQWFLPLRISDSYRCKLQMVFESFNQFDRFGMREEMMGKLKIIMLTRESRWPSAWDHWYWLRWPTWMWPNRCSHESEPLHPGIHTLHSRSTNRPKIFSKQKEEKQTTAMKIDAMPTNMRCGCWH